MLRRIGLVALIAGLGFAGLKLTFTVVCSVGGHSVDEEIWSAWAIAIFTFAIALEVALFAQK